VGGEKPEIATWPFTHEVELKGKKGIRLKIEGLFDDGAMVNSIYKSIFASLGNRLGPLTPSLKTQNTVDGGQVMCTVKWVLVRKCPPRGSHIEGCF